MDTTGFNLCEITQTEYKRRFDDWVRLAQRRSAPRFHFDDAYFSLENPLVIPLNALDTPNDYADLFRKLADHPHADLIAVRDRYKWIKRRGLTGTFDVSGLGVIAHQQINAYVQEHGAEDDCILWETFEMKYRLEPYDDCSPMKSAVLRFVVRKGNVVGYYLRVGNKLEQAFSIQHSGKNYGRVNHAIVDPSK
ncbi:hypothetical protein HYY69_00920 [Candidatus Woesearchaeota archaeon]|nr:hypothetical protein [Candidatus Woesearchaeota archaeon]